MSDRRGVTSEGTELALRAGIEDLLREHREEPRHLADTLVGVTMEVAVLALSVLVVVVSTALRWPRR